MGLPRCILVFCAMAIIVAIVPNFGFAFTFRKTDEYRYFKQVLKEKSHALLHRG